MSSAHATLQARPPARPAGALVIEIEGVTKLYQMGEETIHALRGVSLKIHRNEYLAIMGPSGSGKSTYTRKYLEQYKKKFKNRPIYLFSSLPSDDSLDKIQPKRIKLDDTLHTDPIKVDDLSESICIFDDIDVISNKKIREAVYDILNQVLEIGRHYKIHCVVTNHLPTNGKDTRRILNEAHTVTYFQIGRAHV